MRFFISIFFLFLSFAVFGQKIDQLQIEIENSEKEIERINNLLRSNRRQQIQSDQRVKLLEKRLLTRQNLLKQTNQKISVLETRLRSCDNKVLQCESKIDSIKKYYASLILSYDLLSYSSYSYENCLTLNCLQNSFSNLISSLDSIILLTGVTRNDISSQKKELESLQKKRNIEISQIVSETESLSKLKGELKLGESSMVSQIESHRSRINELQRLIERLISADNLSNIHANSGLSADFLSNKGKLPSPLSVNSRIIDYYGVHDHPSIKGVKVSNKGVNLTVDASADVFAVFDGEVRGVYTIPGMANTVLVRHGKYITVYANLSSVNVVKGDVVKTGQKIGVLFSSNSNDLFLHFELWNESTTLDPTLWIKF